MSTVATKGRHPLLTRYLTDLATHPVRTKAITTGILCFLQEILGSQLAGVPVKSPPRNSPALFHILARSHIDARALKMGLYGMLVSAPLSHFLMGILQRAFAGKTSASARIGQLLASNLIVSPITVSVYLASLAVISGAKTVQEILNTVKAGFFTVLRINWVVSPLSLTIAQKYVPMELWVPFFSSIQFILGTFFNMKVKQRKLAAARREQLKKDAEKDN